MKKKISLAINIVRYIKKNGIYTVYYKLKRKLKINYCYRRYLRQNRITSEQLRLQSQVMFPVMPLISIIVPLFNTPEKYLRAMIESVLCQSYNNWELCIVDGSIDESAYHVVKQYAKKDKRIKLKKLGMNMGISANSNAALELASGDYIALLDHDDLLTPDALYEIIDNIAKNDFQVDLLYSDEDKTDSLGKKFFDPHFKPDFAPDTLRNSNYICHLTVICKAFIDRNNIRFCSLYDGAQDYDVVLRCAEKAERIVHVAKVLYHWRVHSGSTAANMSGSKPYTHEAGKKALAEHLKRMSFVAVVQDSVQKNNVANFYRVKYNILKCARISIIVGNLSDNKHLQDFFDTILVEQSFADCEIILIAGKSTREIFYRYYKHIINNSAITIKCLQYKMNLPNIFNEVVNETNSEYLVFIEKPAKISAGWLREMLSICQREDVGVVGAKILEKDKIYSAGILFDEGNIVQRYKNSEKVDCGYAMQLKAIQNLSAVTAECMMIKKRDFEELGGFDERFEQFFAIDFCLRLRFCLRKLVVFDPYIEVGVRQSAEKNTYHTKNNSEKKMFADQWNGKIKDPYYNKNFKIIDLFDIKRGK